MGMGYFKKRFREIEHESKGYGVPKRRGWLHTVFEGDVESETAYELFRMQNMHNRFLWFIVVNILRRGKIDSP